MDSPVVSHANTECLYAALRFARRHSAAPSPSARLSSHPQLSPVCTLRQARKEYLRASWCKRAVRAAQLAGKELGESLLLPCNMLKADEDIFLDDYTVSQVSDALQVPIVIVKSSGQDLIDAILEERKG